MSPTERENERLKPVAFASLRHGCAGFSLLPCHKRRFTYASALLFWLSLIIISLPSASALSKPSSPVIFIHGIASDAGAWSAFGVFLTENGWIFGGFPTYNRTTGQVAGVTPGDFYTLDFSNNQQLHFDEQGFELAAIIQAVLNANTGETKVVLIGHSMGGLAAREYMQGLARFNQTSPKINYKGDVAQLITVGTPHAGAGLANILSLFPDFIDAFGIDPDSAAVEDLRPGSAAFIVLNDLLANPLPTNVPLASIVGAGTNVIGTFIDGDGIVSVSSQNLGGLDGASGLSHKSKTVFILDRADCDPGFGNALPNETHTCETTDQSVWAELLRELRSSVSNAPFTLSMTASPDPVRPAEFITYTYTVSNPGTTDLSGVELSTLVPDHTSVDPFSITGGGGGCGVICSPGEEVLWSLGTLFAGQSRMVQMAARVDPQPFVGSTAPPDGTLITNSAWVFHPGEGHIAADNTETRVCAGGGTVCDHVVTLPLTFTDDPLTSQVTPVKAVHFTELREAINTLRSNNELGAFFFTDSTLTVGVTQVRAVHLTDLRTALDGVYDALALIRPTYTDPTIVTGATVVKRAHIEEMRSAVRDVE